MTAYKRVLSADTPEPTPIPRFAYLPVTEEHSSDELGYYISHGISVLCDGEELIRIEDVSTDSVAIAELCERCTHLGLDPIHIFDVIDDLLGE